ncbi:MAG: YraN family protein [Lewinella sp.]
MTDRKKTGDAGEALARAYLEGQGYRIDRTNYRYRRTEIDLIGWDGNILVFVEVKTRTSQAFGHPSIFFKPAQQRRISRAASAYMEEIDYEWEIRFDLIAILYRSETDYRLDHYPDVFFPGLH